MQCVGQPRFMQSYCYYFGSSSCFRASRISRSERSMLLKLQNQPEDEGFIASKYEDATS